MTLYVKVSVLSLTEKAKKNYLLSFTHVGSLGATCVILCKFTQKANAVHKQNLKCKAE